MVEFVDKCSEAGAVGGKQIIGDGTVLQCCSRFPTAIIEVYGNTIFGKIIYCPEPTC